MTLQEFLTLNAGNDCITVCDKKEGSREINYYCEEKNKGEILTSDTYKEISGRTIKDWVVIGGGMEKVEIYITLNNCQESDTGEAEEQKEAYGMNADQVIECMKFYNQYAKEGIAFKEILDQITKKPENETKDRKDEILEELDKAIMSICKDIYCDEAARNVPDAELVKALADLVEVRSCLPDYKFRRN